MPLWEARVCVSIAGLIHHQQNQGRSCSILPGGHQSTGQTKDAQIIRPGSNKYPSVFDMHLIVGEAHALLSNKATEERHWYEAEEDYEEDSSTDDPLGFRAVKTLNYMLVYSFIKKQHVLVKINMLCHINKTLTLPFWMFC